MQLAQIRSYVEEAWDNTVWMDLQYRILDMNTLEYDWWHYKQHQSRKIRDKDLCTFHLYTLCCLNIQSLLSILDGNLVETQCKWANKNMMGIRLNFCIVKMHHKVTDNKGHDKDLAQVGAQELVKGEVRII